jgi:putative protease
MNLASHIKDILDSGVIDSLKIEGRTKSPYYVGVVTRAYRQAIDDYYGDAFEPSRYQAELETTQNRGFTDAYLISRPFEKSDTQSTGFTIQDGTHQVAGLVGSDGTTWRCKDKTCIGDLVEIVLPVGAKLEEVSNQYGDIFMDELGRWWLRIKKIKSTNKKEFECIHSGDLNNIITPVKFPPFTILRRDITESKKKKGLL